MALFLFAFNLLPGILEAEELIQVASQKGDPRDWSTPSALLSFKLSTFLGSFTGLFSLTWILKSANTNLEMVSCPLVPFAVALLFLCLLCLVVCLFGLVVCL